MNNDAARIALAQESSPASMRYSVPCFARKCQAAGSRAALFRWLAFASCIWLLAGCSKNSEPPITGRHSAAPVSLRCAWQPGFRYHLRLELSVLTDPGMPEMAEANLHRVTFAEECLVTATNA